LVRPLLGQRVEEHADRQQEEGVLVKRGDSPVVGVGEVGEILAVFRRDAPDGGQSAVDFMEHDAEQIEDAEVDHDQLDHVGPDDRLDAADDRVEGRAEADDQHQRPHRNSDQRFERDRRGVNHHTDVESAHQQEEAAPQQPDRQGEPPFQILVGRDDPEIEVEPDEDEDDHRRRQERRQPPDAEPLQPVAEEIRGAAEDADGAHQRRQDRHSGSPPGD